MFELVIEDITDEQITEEAAEYGPLAESVRRLIDATIRTERRGEAIRRATAAIDALAAELAGEQLPGPYGVRFTQTGTFRAWGNAAAGLRNPIAPPLDLQVEADGTVWAEVELGAAYEGPPTLVHGGISALILDQALGRAAEAASAPGFTGTLEVRYRRPTRLGALRVEAKLDRIDGVKSFVVGTISDAEGVCVEGTGVFIMPSWTRSDDQRLEAVREARAASAGFTASPSAPTGHVDPPAPS